MSKVALYSPNWDGHFPNFALSMLNALRKSGVEVSLIISGRGVNLWNKTSSPQLGVYLIHASGIRSRFEGYLKTMQVAKERDVDILHLLGATNLSLFSESLSFLLPLIFVRPRKFKIVISVFGISNIDIPRNSVGPFAVFLKFVWKYLSRRIDLVIVHSNSPDLIARQIAGSKLAYWSKLLPKMVYAFDTREPDERLAIRMSLSKSEARRRLGLPLGIPVLLYYGVVWRRKGPDVLMQALGDIKRKVILVCAGELREYSNMIEEARQALVSNDRGPTIVVRQGRQTDEETDWLFRAADAVVMPYRSEHGRSTPSGVLSQAVSANAWVICTDVGAIGAFVKSFGVGLVAEPNSSESFANAINMFLDGALPATYPPEVQNKVSKYLRDSSIEELCTSIMKYYALAINDTES